MFFPTPPRDIDHVPPSYLQSLSLEGAPAFLAELQEGGEPDFSAFRAAVPAEDEDYFQRPEVQAGLDAILRGGRPLRLKLMWGQLASFAGSLAELLKAGAPEVPVVLTIRGGFRGIQGIEKEATQRWKSTFKSLATLPNVYVELIGVQSALPPELSQERRRIIMRPFLRTALCALGPERLIIGDPTLTARRPDGTIPDEVLQPWLEDLRSALAYVQDERPELDVEEALRRMTRDNARSLFGEHFRECLTLESGAARR